MTIAQQLKVKDFPFIIKDSKGNIIYREDSTGYWSKHEYDTNGNPIYWGDSKGSWGKSKYDANGNKIYWEDSTGYWEIREYDANGNLIYLGNPSGYVDNRPKTVELSMDEIAKKFGISVSQLKIKK